ncbi:type zinc knuckle [Cryptosporidium sp. chipmunk genotype I]|uniref:type zinc knuckle n=1 Tax=Cryptosporidium sp. chipmunk genotype I TaxID=1280935 RepID=UPI00351A7536|nr:type zinc knuckle [Cryptosporidium sp. chipmunk genotype I]
MDQIIDDNEYPSNFPLEKITSHLNISLKLLEKAQIQWMNEKESLLREIERLRMENRTLRMEVRSSENLERNSVSNTPNTGRMKGYYLVNNDSGQIIPIPANPVNQVVERSCSNSNNMKRASDLLEIQNITDRNTNIIPNRNSISASRIIQNEQISPATSSQNCRVRHIQLEDENSDHEPLEKKKKTIKYREVGKNIGKKEQRNNLQAFECTECSKFYKAINNTKASNSQSMCKHLKQNLLQNSGRHRFKHPPIKSPPGYWDLDEI